MEYTGIFQGGGVKGFAYIGAICALEENKIYCTKAAGTSIGAIFASLLMCGYTGKELAYLSKYINLEDLVDKQKQKITKCIKERGLYSTNRIEILLDELYKVKGYHYLSELNHNDESILKVVASDITNRKKIIFPDDLINYNINEIPIAKAVTMSISYPLFFKPLKLNNSTIIDGGIYDNFPTEIINDQNPKIGFKILDNKIKNNKLDYLIEIDTKKTKKLNFKISHNEKRELFESGYYKTLETIDKIKKENKNMI